MVAILKTWNLQTLFTRLDGLHRDIHTIEAWCQNSIKDLEERITSAFATNVDMIDMMEERIEDVEKLHKDQKKIVDANTHRKAIEGLRRGGERGQIHGVGGRARIQRAEQTPGFQKKAEDRGMDGAHKVPPRNQGYRKVRT